MFNRPTDQLQAREVRIWDLPIRLFHWALVILLAGSWITGEWGGSWLKWHFWSGYSILGLLIFRIFWGFAGSSTAKFTSFLYGPRATLAHFRHLLQRKPDQAFGHNPAGGWMVLILILVLLLQTITGLFADDDIATTGPLASRVSYDTVQLLTTIHRLNFNLILGLAGLHIAAVLIYLAYARTNLIWAMWTGRKRLPENTYPLTPLRFATLSRAAILLLLAGIIVAAIVQFGG